jgi:hypothetical protein
MKLSKKITPKQQTIIKLLYKHRFLNRIQLQALMGHTDYKRINAWLKDLREKQYIEWIYSTDFSEKTKPAIYYVSLNGVRFLRSTNEYPVDQLRNRYRESSRKHSFISRCVLLGDCCITLISKSSTNTHYTFVTQADYADPKNEYHFLGDELMPHLCFTKHESSEESAGDEIVTNYLLEVFDSTLPRYRLKKRLKDYVDYLNDDYWSSERDDSSPAVLLVCPNVADLIYAKRRTRKLIEDAWNDEDIHIRFTTEEKLKQHGVTAEIWEEPRPVH